MFVVFVELAKVGQERCIINQIQRFRMKHFTVESVNGKHITQLGLGLEPEVDVVAEQEPITDREHITSDAVVFRRDPLRR